MSGMLAHISSASSSWFFLTYGDLFHAWSQCWSRFLEYPCVSLDGWSSEAGIPERLFATPAMSNCQLTRSVRDSIGCLVGKRETCFGSSLSVTWWTSWGCLYLLSSSSQPSCSYSDSPAQPASASSSSMVTLLASRYSCVLSPWTCTKLAFSEKFSSYRHQRCNQCIEGKGHRLCFLCFLLLLLRLLKTCHMEWLVTVLLSTVHRFTNRVDFRPLPETWFVALWFELLAYFVILSIINYNSIFKKK